MDFGSLSAFSLANELELRFKEIEEYEKMTQLELQKVQMGSSAPQLYGSLSKFVANPSTVSTETYKRMVDTDETVGSGLEFLILSLIARFGDYTHPVPEVQEFVRKALENMKGSWHENLSEMFSCEWGGFSITEPVWTYTEDFSGMPAFVPKKLVTYPPVTIVFAVDRHGEVLPEGVYQYQRFHNASLSSLAFGMNDQNGFRPDLYASVGDFPYPIRLGADLSYQTVRIPLHKVIHLRATGTGTFNNPYGRSILRRAYKNWVLKDAFLKMWLVGADRKGTPLLVGYARPNDTVLARNDTGSGQGETTELRADEAMASAFRTIHGSSFLVFPGMKGEVYDVDKVDIQGDMNIFKDGVGYFNRALMRSLLVPDLVFTSGDGSGSYALGDIHSKTYYKICDGKNKVYKQGITDQFIKPLVKYNFPRSAWEKHGFGTFQLEEHDPEVMKVLGEIFQQLTNDGYMSPKVKADLDHVRQKMGLPKNVDLSALEKDPLDAFGPGFEGNDPNDPHASNEPGAPPREPGDRNANREDENVQRPNQQPAKDPPRGSQRMARSEVPSIETVKGTTTVAVMCGTELLMGSRRDNGKWTMPGGGMDPGEAPLAGAIRELREEAGIEASSLSLLDSQEVSGRTGRKVVVHAFKLELANKPATRTAMDPDEEVLNWQWIDVKDGLPPDIAGNLQSPRNTLLIHLGLIKDPDKPAAH